MSGLMQNSQKHLANGLQKSDADAAAAAAALLSADLPDDDADPSEYILRPLHYLHTQTAWPQSWKSHWKLTSQS